MKSVSLTSVIDQNEIKALIFDVDGTLYRQAPVRRKMALRLAARALKHPREMVDVFRALHTYGSAQEGMRQGCADCNSLSEEQIRRACRSSGISESIMACHVSTWMEQAPLDLLAPAMRDGVLELLQDAKNRSVRLAVWSDYPAMSKLKAMGLDLMFDAVISAQSNEVQRFKPDPRGMEILLDRLGVNRNQALYIGDRLEVDGVAATRAGVRCVIVGKPARNDQAGQWPIVHSFIELSHALTKMPCG